MRRKREIAYRGHPPTRPGLTPRRNWWNPRVRLAPPGVRGDFAEPSLSLRHDSAGDRARAGGGRADAGAGAGTAAAAAARGPGRGDGEGRPLLPAPPPPALDR